MAAKMGRTWICGGKSICGVISAFKSAEMFIPFMLFFGEWRSTSSIIGNSIVYTIGDAIVCSLVTAPVAVAVAVTAPVAAAGTAGTTQTAVANVTMDLNWIDDAVD
jgi:hypothetical protein